MGSPHTRLGSSRTQPLAAQSLSRAGGEETRCCLPRGVLGRKPGTVWRVRKHSAGEGKTTQAGLGHGRVSTAAGAPRAFWAGRRSAVPCAPPSSCPHKRALSAVIHLGPAARGSLSFGSHSRLTEGSLSLPRKGETRSSNAGLGGGAGIWNQPCLSDHREVWDISFISLKKYFYFFISWFIPGETGQVNS